MKNTLLKYVSLFERQLFGFATFGRDSLIRPPVKIWNPRHIKIGTKVFIAENAFLSVVTNSHNRVFDPVLEIGSGVCIGRNFHVSCVSHVLIEENVLISDNVYIGDGYHGFEALNTPIIYQPMISKGPVKVRKDSFIGINSVILPGVTIGAHSVVGASSVVTRSVPDYCVVAGNPARVIRFLKD